MNDIAIKLENVSKFYKLYNSPGDRLKEALSPLGKIYHKDFYAIRHINLEVKKGEILGIVGKNGCGKSTLLKLIAGVLTPNEGQVFVDGRISAMLELSSGFNPEFTGVQNIYFYLTILGLSKAEIDNRIDEIIAFSDIGEFIHQPLKTYSSGMKSRLGFAVAINVDPEILILDEVLAVGDVQYQRKCYSKIREFFKQGKTVIFVSHNSGSIIDFCSRAILIFEGNIILDGAPKYIIDSYQKLMFSKKQKEVVVELIGTGESEIEVCDDSGTKGLSDNTRSESYNFSLVPKPLITQIYDVNIENIMIINMRGEQVNVLNKGENYSIEYEVVFNMKDHVTYLSTGIAIKSIKGVLIGGSRDYFQPLESTFNKGDRVAIQRSLTVELIDGYTYVIKLDVMGSVFGKEELLFSIADALIFEVNKVKRSDSCSLMGLVDLNQNVCMNKCG